METLIRPKKASPSKKDWHPADIVAALRKAGWSLRQLSQHHGYAPGALTSVNRPGSCYPKGQSLVAKAIGVHPMEIWPSRYHKDGSPIRKTPGRRATQPPDATINVIEALRQRGLSLRQLAQQHGYYHLGKVMQNRWPAAQRIVADALELEPWDIWPSRYHPDHTPIRDPRGRKPMRRTPGADQKNRIPDPGNSSTGTEAANGNDSGADKQ